MKPTTPIIAKSQSKRINMAKNFFFTFRCKQDCWNETSSVLDRTVLKTHTPNVLCNGQANKKLTDFKALIT